MVLTADTIDYSNSICFNNVITYREVKCVDRECSDRLKCLDRAFRYNPCDTICIQTRVSCSASVEQYYS